MIGTSKYEEGNILATSLLVMLAMNLLAVTLVQTSVREFKTADYKQADSTNFYLAESCIDDSIGWFKSLTKPPTNLPYSIVKNNISHLYNGDETQLMLNQLGKYSYNCTTSSITVKSVEGQSAGTGENVGTTDAYGISGDLRPKYFYQIDSNSAGPTNSRKRLISIVEVQF